MLIDTPPYFLQVHDCIHKEGTSCPLLFNHFNWFSGILNDNISSELFEGLHQAKLERVWPDWNSI